MNTVSLHEPALGQGEMLYTRVPVILCYHVTLAPVIMKIVIDPSYRQYHVVTAMIHTKL